MRSLKEQNTSAKKQWSKPVLIVLGRTNPHESVLASCKNHKNPTGVVASATETNCNELQGTVKGCGACKSNGNDLS